MFNIKDFLIKSIIKSFEEGSMGEGQAGMTTMQYFLKGMLTEEDVNHINKKITEIKEERQRQAEEQERLEQEEQEEIKDTEEPIEEPLEDEEPLEEELIEDEEPPEEDEE